MFLVIRGVIRWQRRYTSDNDWLRILGIVVSGLVYFALMVFATWISNQMSDNNYKFTKDTMTKQQTVLNLERGLLNAEHCKLGPGTFNYENACKSSKSILVDHYKLEMGGKLDLSPKYKRYQEYLKYLESTLDDSKNETGSDDSKNKAGSDDSKNKMDYLIHEFKGEILEAKSEVVKKNISEMEMILSGTPLSVLKATGKNINILFALYVYLGLSWIVHCAIVSGDFKPKWIEKENAATEDDPLSRSQKEDREYNAKLKKIEDQFDEEVWKAESKRSQALLKAKNEKDQAS
ncbi:hypothetical protein AB4455_07880 [Vibrio sp. 10N.261.46.E12]|uniref:hypothetical protein n=1 Tax=unclassified Vibrio TaxID=2614977 RepID=UPI001054E264|nr:MULTISPECIES: hypothetical protein [unclassified Vibrio]